MRENNIRAVLTVADCFLKYEDDKYIDNHYKIPVEDFEDFNISEYFTNCFEFIN